LARWSRGDPHATLCDIRNYFSSISELLTSEKGQLFRQRHVDFIRSRVLSPELVVLLLLYLVADAGKRGYQLLLRAFWDECSSHGLPLRSETPVTGQAFCAARRKLKPELLRQLVVRSAAQWDSQHGASHRFRGFRVLAIDGAKINLNRGDELFDYFGAPSGGHYPQMLLSTLYNPLSKRVHDLRVAPQDGDERRELEELMPSLSPGDLLVADRGYPSFRIFEKLLQAGCHFVIRSPKAQTFKGVQSFVESGRKQGWVTLYPPSGYPHPEAAPIKLRIAVFREFGDDPIVLLTDLGSKSLTRQDLLTIYRLRWKIEEFYGLAQGDCLGQRQYHATTPEGIMQEVFAMALLINLVRSCASAAADQHGVSYQHLCEKEAVLATASYLTRLLLHTDLEILSEIFDRLLRRIGTCTYKPRPGRSHPRRSFKPRSKWCATGKRGEK